MVAHMQFKSTQKKKTFVLSQLFFLSLSSIVFLSLLMKVAGATLLLAFLHSAFVLFIVNIR